MKEIVVGVAALFWGLCCAVFYREKMPAQLVKERDEMRHDARWP